MPSAFDDVLERGRCAARVRLFGLLWRVECGGRIDVRPSTFHPGRNYCVCRKCGDVTWKPRIPVGVPYVAGDRL